MRARGLPAWAWACAAVVSALGLTSPARAQRTAPIERARIEALLSPTAEDPGALPPPEVKLDGPRAELTFRDGAERCGLTLFPVADAGPEDMSSGSFGMRRAGQAATDCGGLVSRAINRVQAHDRRAPGPRHDPSGAGASPGSGPPTVRTPAARPRAGLLDLWLITFGLLEVVLLPAALLQAVLVLDGGSRRTAALVAAAALLVRALAPHRLVMVYFGYHHVGEAVDLEALPRYGPGATMLWWLLLRAVPADHAFVQWLHVVLGSLAAGLLAAWVQRATGSARAALSTGALLVLTPLLVRDHGSESMAVGAELALAGAAILVGELVPPLAGGAALEGPVRRSLLALLVLALYAASCRPDLLLVIAPVLLLLAWARHPIGEAGRALGRATPWLAALALLALPLVAAALGHAREDAARGNLPRADGLLSSLPRLLLRHDVLLRPRDFPLLVALPVAAAFTGGAARRALPLVAAALLAMAPTFIDHNETSDLRLQAPAVCLYLLAAGLGFAALERRPRGALLSGAALVLALASMVPSVRPLLAARNPDQEERLVREALAAIERDRRGPALLGRPGYGDIAVRDVHLHFPDYLFRARGVEPVDLGELTGRRDAPSRYFLRSFRCWLWPAWDHAPHPAEHPACSDVCQRARCAPVFERDAENLHDWPTFDGYGAAPTLRVGLYRLEEPVDGGALRGAAPR